jgi:hypothetical protein
MDTHAIVTHLGVGDAIVQTGLAIALLDRYEAIAFPAYPQYAETVRSFFALHDRISIYPVPRIPGEDYGSPRDPTYTAALNAASLDLARQIRLGLYSGRGIGWDFTKSFYEHAGVDYAMRWRACPIRDAWPRVGQLDVKPSPRRIFVHDDRSRNFVIRRERIGHGFVLEPNTQDIGTSILKYASYLIDADEIHCIDSSFFWLADHLPVKGRLFLHKYARWQRPHDFRYETYRHWNYLS